MNKYFSLLLILFAFVFQSQLMGQTPSQLPGKLSQYSVSNLQEKIYAHLDRSDHLTGEILWFKLYVVDATLHKPLDFSKVAYVEILDQNNNPVLQTKVSLENSSGNGSLYLPSTLNTGVYSFRAYTNWMKNQGADFFFQKTITLINTLKPFEGSQKKPVSSLHIEVFPEGGHLIANVKNRLAFKTIDSQGNGVGARVAILNSRNDTIAKSNTHKFGIGRLEFTPEQGIQYTMTAIDGGFRKSKIELPAAANTGYAMMVSDTAGLLRVSIRSQSSYSDLTLIVHTRRSIKFSSTKSSSGALTVFEIDKNKLGAGVSHLTVFGAQGQPLCERLYFIKPEPNQLKIDVNQKEFNVRRKVSLSISPIEKGAGDYSVSVFRADSIGDNTSIVTNLFLTSDLVGNIEHTEYYFSEDAGAALAADNLMLTHGWRRFTWSALQSNNEIKHLPEIRGHLIQGRIVDQVGNGVAGKAGFLASPGKNIRIYTALSNPGGIIRFQMKGFQTEGKVIAQTDYLTDSLLHLEIQNPFHAQYATWTAKDLNLNSLVENSLLVRSIGMQVQDIFSEDETYFNFAKQAPDTIPFYGTPDETYLLDDYTRFPVMEEVMREYVKSVWVRKNKDNFRFRVIDKLNGGLFKENPLVIVDGVPVFDINQVMQFDPLKIKRLDVLARKYYLGPVELSGILSFSTYSGDLGNLSLDPRSITINYEGLQQQREFYNPKYETASKRTSRLPDQRYQLVWNPGLKWQAGKETLLDFYTSDVVGKFYIVAEGLSTTGTPFYGIQSFMVSR